MNLYQPNISPCLKRALLFFMCCAFVFHLNVKAQNTSPPKKLNPVPVVLIGGLGSTLLSQKKDPIPCANDLINNKTQLVKYFSNLFLGNPKNLAFDEHGNPKPGSVSGKLKAVGYLRLPSPLKDICDLSLYLQKGDYKNGVNLFEFYYDFRYSAEYNAEELRKFVKTNIKTKFNIVAHSYGGLIAKEYLTHPEDAAMVDKLIMVETPNLGTPLAFTFLRNGLKNIFPQIPLLKGCSVKNALHNAPALFNLLPGEKYFARQKELFGQGGYLIDRTGRLLNFDKTVDFLKNQPEVGCLEKEGSTNEKLSGLLIDEYLLKLHRERDNWPKPDNVKVYALAGYGLETIETIQEDKDGKIINVCRTTAGDTISPVWSSELANATQNFYIDLKTLDTEHMSMIGKKEIDQGILNLLQDKQPDQAIFRTEPPDKSKWQHACH